MPKLDFLSNPATRVFLVIYDFSPQDRYCYTASWRLIHIKVSWEVELNFESPSPFKENIFIHSNEEWWDTFKYIFMNFPNRHRIQHRWRWSSFTMPKNLQQCLYVFTIVLITHGTESNLRSYDAHKLVLLFYQMFQWHWTSAARTRKYILHEVQSESGLKWSVRSLECHVMCRSKKSK